MPSSVQPQGQPQEQSQGQKPASDKNKKKRGPKTHRCEQCRRSFSDTAAKNQHLLDSPRHRTNGTLALNTPLDKFFRSFSGFPYDPKLSPEMSFKNLKSIHRWENGDAEDRAAWNDYKRALAEEVTEWFGKEDDINSWHTLCRATGVVCPDTISECEKLLRNTHINIVDLIDWARNGQNDKSVRVFKTKRDLVLYTKQTGKIFPQDDVVSSEGDRNVVLRHLLRRMSF
ncbi:hypothetical protein F5Y19DRAFT_30665 [Xylariaceae sp. FL1651]|nr:hypothetical protein F5Y19DRAFT_30665 [Xylariaceae sp. FL1651]